MTATTEARVGVYEVMFLASQSAAATLGELVDHINDIFSRANAEVIALRKWDERRLAYEIDKQKRGVYFLAYINCPGDQIGHIERDVTISEQLMRVLILKADHLTSEEMLTHEKRDELAVEAKLKADMPVEEEHAAKKVHIGAPAKDEIDAPADAPAEPTKGEPAKDEAPGEPGDKPASE